MEDLCKSLATTGKPIIVSKWSGYTDFLPESNTVYLDGEVKQIHQSHKTNFYLKNQSGSMLIIQKSGKIFDVYKNYKTYLQKVKV